MFTFFLEVRWLLRCKRHTIIPCLRTLMDDRGIIGTGWHPVKLRAIHPGTVTMPKDVMKYILSNRMLKKSLSGAVKREA